MNVVTKAAKHSAPGPYLGFALQPLRLFYPLLTCPAKASVSLEYLDDVAVHLPSGDIVLEQTKSALKHNPLSDWAEDLWKAIANWVALIDAGKINPAQVEFRLYVTPIHAAGTLAEQISEATTPPEIDATIAEIKNALAALRRPPKCMPFVKAFLDASPSVQRKIVERIQVVSTDDDPLKRIESLLQPAIDPAIAQMVCRSAIGLAKEQADQLIREGSVPLIDGDAFKAKFRHLVKLANLPGVLQSITSPPPEHEVGAILLARPIFIRQLELVAASNDLQVRAVSDYLRSSADKSAWAEAGLVLPESLRDWDDNLIARQNLIATEIADTQADKDEPTRGRLVYVRCSQLQAPLEGRVVPGHFVNGCFNALADLRRLGWHPNYVALLSES